MTTPERELGSMSKEELIRELRKLEAADQLATSSATRPDRERLIHELHVHQVELEMQNRELREAQERIEEVSARYVDLYDYAPVGYCTLDAAGLILEVNLTGATMLGSPRGRLLGTPLANVVLGADKPDFRGHLAQCLRGTTRVTTDLRVSGSREGACVVRMISEPVSDPHGGPSALRTILVDVSGTKALEWRLELLSRAGQQLSRSLDAMATLEAAARLVVPDLADLCMIDLVQDDGAVDRPLVVFADPKKQATLAERMRRVQAGPGVTTAQEATIASGEPMLLAEVPPEPPGTRGDEPADLRRAAGVRSLMVIPLSAAGRTFGALSLASGESKRIFNQADVGLASELAGRVAVALDNARLYADRRRAEKEQRFFADVGASLASTLDYEDTPANIAQLTVNALSDVCIVEIVDGGPTRRKVAHRDPRQAATARALAGTQSGSFRPGDETIVMSDVSREQLRSIGASEDDERALADLDPRSLIAAPLQARGRKLGVLLLVSTDPARRYTKADVPVATELARRAALAIDNARIYRVAQQAIRARDDVLAVVAHDLRNPLSTVMLQTARLRRGEPGRDVERRTRTPVDVIDGAARRMTRIIQDLLDVASIEAGLPPSNASVPVGNMMREALEAQTPLANGGGVALALDLGPGVADVAVRADHHRLLQVFENLVGNALRFTHEHGTVTLGAECKGAEVLFSVKDTGTGISPEDLPHLFDRFWKASALERQGAGLGLAIVKGIVEAQGGSVSATSTPGDGSTISFTLPIAARQQQAPVVLLAEDDAELRAALRDVLTLAGYSVVAVDNGQEALDYLRQVLHPSFVVLDLVMPVMDGWAFLEEKNADPALESIPVIVISGQQGIAERVGAERALLVDKPIDTERLLKTLEESEAAGGARRPSA